MNQSTFEHAESLRIATVEFVSPSEIKALLDIDAPDSVALNAGSPRPFPRVNGYVLVPVDEAFLVGQIEWLTVERSPFPKRRGMQDFGLIDLPYPLRRMSLNPLGILRIATDLKYEFRRGAHALPSIGDSVQLPTEEQLRAIAESGERRRVRIGTSPLTAGAEVRVDPDRLFGRHLAVLGNTGSGKSCSVAGIIRWSLEAAALDMPDQISPDARFIILDPNGEYSQAFGDSNDRVTSRTYQVGPTSEASELRVPLWLWNVPEWVSFSQATARTQRPALIQALRFLRGEGQVPPKSAGHELRRFMRIVVNVIDYNKNVGTPFADFPQPKNFYQLLEKWNDTIRQYLGLISEDVDSKLETLSEQLNTLCISRRQRYPAWQFTLGEVNELLSAAREAYATLGGEFSDFEAVDADIPRPFTADAFISAVEASAEMLNVSEHVETLIIRLRSMLSDEQLASIVDDASEYSLESWLSKYLGNDDQDSSNVTIIDLSLVPTNVVHIVTSVIARVIFEALQRYRKVNGQLLPTVLVMEEAHTFIKRYREESEIPDAATVCCQVFERIAREGRKFGLGLVLSSQRPSELSPSVLSQCNSVLLHRISNDRDQDLVHRFVPDNLRGLLRELPSLPSQHGILMGWATALPLLVKMDDLQEDQRPQSEDPNYWDVWAREDAAGYPVNRPNNWGLIAEDWQGIPSERNAGPRAEPGNSGQDPVQGQGQ